MFMAALSLSLMDIFIYIFIIIFLVIGFIRGFVKIVFSFIKGIVALLLTYVLTGPMSKLLCLTSLDESITKSVHDVLIKKAPSLNNVIDFNSYKDQIASASDEAGIPGFIGDIISNFAKFDESSAGVTVGNALSQSIASMIINVIAFIIMFILLTICVSLLSRLFSYFISFGGLKKVDRILGMTINSIYGVLVVSIIFLFASIIASAIPSLNETISGFIYPYGYDENSFSIARWLYENNPMKFIIEGLFKVKIVS